MIDDLLKNIPKLPGIYQYFDKNGKIIYIGKSVNLFSRVHSYFNGKSKLNFAKQKMVDQICDIQTIIVNNEKESLILETTLIKKYLPKYNILMKDGKNHIYIKITTEKIPRIITTRVKGKTGIYFGPYISTGYVKNILKIAKKIFGYRSCNLKFELDTDNQHLRSQLLSYEQKELLQKKLIIKNQNIKIPCLDYYIKRCSGPCLLKQKEIQEYNDSIENISNFLKGNFEEVKKDLTAKMLDFAKKLNFEKAEEIKRDLLSLESLNENQVVKDLSEKNINILQYLEKFDKAFIGILKIRDHKITGFYSYEIANKLEEEKEKVVRNFIEQENIEDNQKYIIPFNINVKNTEIPKIGTKLDLLKLCYKNIYECAYKKHLSSLSTKGFTKQNMKNLLHILNYERINKKVLFECNDISHLSGTHTVASRSIIENGKTANSKYRKFRIKNLEVGKIDDFNSMREIMERRIKEIEKTGEIPDLIIIDGGKGQLSSVIEIIESYLQSKDKQSDSYELVKKLQLVGLAKREEELFTLHNGVFERTLLEKDSLELRLVQKIRDEAHRFAITFNRDSRIKSMKTNILESLPGFGPTTRRKLLKEFGSVENLREVNRKDLVKILNKNQIETLDDHGLI